MQHTTALIPLFFTAEITGIAAADLVHDFLSLLTAEAPPKAWSNTVRPNENEL
jgi:hypothetical protein